MKNHLNSSRFITIFGVTVITLTTLVTLSNIDKDIGIAAVGPAFIALGILWGALGVSKIAEHGTRHLNRGSDGEH